MLLLASLTEPIVNLATNVIDSIGLAGVAVLMMLESACIPIPSEATMLFAGFNVADGHYSLLAVTLVGTAANLVGSWIAYAVGYYGRIEVLETHGRKLHISRRNLEQADRWFEHYGSAAVFFARLLPVARTFISLPAGVARMPLLRFSVLTFLGSLPWVFLLAFAGKEAGDNWRDWEDKLRYVDYLVAVLIVAAAVYLVVRWYRRRNEPAADAAEHPADIAS
ncbi:MAG TPA: DedA family protein [Conexibacter sp.]|jgi:membrane protein DedA with SNARE-associated domain